MRLNLRVSRQLLMFTKKCSGYFHFSCQEFSLDRLFFLGNERGKIERRFICFMRDIKISAKLGNPIVFRPVRFHEELMRVSSQTRAG